MYRIFGLGNFGEEYQDTPHNIGRQVLEIFLKDNDNDFKKGRRDKKRNSQIFQGEMFGENLELIFLENFMNNSGDAFNGIFSKNNEKEKEKIIIIQDDIDLPFGEFRISFNRGDGGHNGIKDIIKKIKTKKIIRIRIGVCPLDFFGKCRKPKSGQAVNKYLVEKQLGRKYTQKYQDYSEKVKEILKEIFKHSKKSAMNKFN